MLLTAIASPVLSQAFITEFARGGLGRTLLRFSRSRPIGAIAAPVPRVVAMSSTIRHTRSFPPGRPRSLLTSFETAPGSRAAELERSVGHIRPMLALLRASAEIALLVVAANPMKLTNLGEHKALGDKHK